MESKATNGWKPGEGVGASWSGAFNDVDRATIGAFEDDQALLMGDDSLDETRGIAVLSGDKTMAYLAKKYKASKVIFVSDVDGVFDKNPKVYKDARLIKEINSQNFKKVIDSMVVFNKNDASGEMKGKLEAIQNDLRGFQVQIINGLEKFALRKFFLGLSPGTKIIL